MSSYVFVYRAPSDYGPGTPDAPAAWQAWFEQLGGSLLDAGNPVFARRVIGSGPSETVLGGYSLVSAVDLDAAVKLAEGCPYLGAGGSVEVGELTLLNPSTVHTVAADHAAATGS